MSVTTAPDIRYACENIQSGQFNGLGYHATGFAKWYDRREHRFDIFVPDPIVCLHPERYGPEIEKTDRERGLWSIPKECIGYTVTCQTCVALNAVDLAAEDFQTEEHFARMLQEEDRRR